MSARRLRPMTKWLAMAVSLTMVHGCIVATDLVNPVLLTSLGFDPATVIPPEGRLLVAFTNSTSSAALFFAQASDDPTDPLSNLRSLDTETGSPLAAGETRTLVLDCPVGVVTPGTEAAADFATGTTAVTVLEATPVEIAYVGAPLILDREFECGDVIQMEVTQLGTGGAFTLSIRVIPGR